VHTPRRKYASGSVSDLKPTKPSQATPPQPDLGPPSSQVQFTRQTHATARRLQTQPTNKFAGGKFHLGHTSAVQVTKQVLISKATGLLPQQLDQPNLLCGRQIAMRRHFCAEESTPGRIRGRSLQTSDKHLRPLNSFARPAHRLPHHRPGSHTIVDCVINGRPRIREGVGVEHLRF
jgi:hypothetical protein